MTSLLLISSSTVHGTGYLDHAADELASFFSGIEEILFVPWALYDADTYAEQARERFARIGIRAPSLHAQPDPIASIESARGFFFGGGNTFRLRKALADRSLLPAIRRRVESGGRYAGSSAGANLACPTIRTTNDMPIVEPGSFSALSLVPFQINPHYVDPDPSSGHQGETREERIRQFHEEPENARTVVGLREGAMLRREGSELRLKGGAGARIFPPGDPPYEVSAPADLSEFLNELKP
ncbi:MAG: dipeptidase PepE [Acidobacteriota bacterium]